MQPNQTLPNQNPQAADADGVPPNPGVANEPGSSAGFVDGFTSNQPLNAGPATNQTVADPEAQGAASPAGDANSNVAKPAVKSPVATAATTPVANDSTAAKVTPATMAGPVVAKAT